MASIRIFPTTQANAAQVALQKKQIPSTVNLLLQHEEDQQVAQAQTIQMITALLLSDEDEAPAQFQTFLPLVTR